MKLSKHFAQCGSVREPLLLSCVLSAVMAAWLPRRLNPRVVLMSLLLLALLSAISSIGWTVLSSQRKLLADELVPRKIDETRSGKVPSERCVSLHPSQAAIDTAVTYSTLNFQVTCVFQVFQILVHPNKIRKNLKKSEKFGKKSEKIQKIRKNLEIWKSEKIQTI